MGLIDEISLPESPTKKTTAEVLGYTIPESAKLGNVGLDYKRMEIKKFI